MSRAYKRQIRSNCKELIQMLSNNLPVAAKLAEMAGIANN
jgi:hypothetical protein